MRGEDPKCEGSKYFYSSYKGPKQGHGNYFKAQVYTT